MQRWPSRQSSASPSTSRRRGSSLPFWSAAWLALGLTFASLDLIAEIRYARIFDGNPHYPSEWYAAATGILAVFPFDRHLERNARLILRRLEDR